MVSFLVFVDLYLFVKFWVLVISLDRNTFYNKFENIEALEKKKKRDLENVMYKEKLKELGLFSPKKGHVFLNMLSLSCLNMLNVIM